MISRNKLFIFVAIAAFCGVTFMKAAELRSTNPFNEQYQANGLSENKTSISANDMMNMLTFARECKDGIATCIRAGKKIINGVKTTTNFIGKCNESVSLVMLAPAFLVSAVMYKIAKWTSGSGKKSDSVASAPIIIACTAGACTIAIVGIQKYFFDKNLGRLEKKIDRLRGQINNVNENVSFVGDRVDLLHEKIDAHHADNQAALNKVIIYGVAHYRGIQAALADHQRTRAEEAAKIKGQIDELNNKLSATEDSLKQHLTRESQRTRQILLHGIRLQIASRSKFLKHVKQLAEDVQQVRENMLTKEDFSKGLAAQTNIIKATLSQQTQANHNPVQHNFNYMKQIAARQKPCNR